MESTTAMHALMLEISWPLPWLVSVPSRRSTIWGCCGGGDGERASGRCAIARSPALSKTTRRARERGGTREGESRANRAGEGGLGRHTHDHLPVGHLHQRARHDDRPRGDQCARATSVDSFCLNCCPRVSRRLLRASLRATREE
jgi:hypothetical protein